MRCFLVKKVTTFGAGPGSRVAQRLKASFLPEACRGALLVEHLTNYRRPQRHVDPPFALIRLCQAEDAHRLKSRNLGLGPPQRRSLS
jgi:hypothetical protein